MLLKLRLWLAIRTIIAINWVLSKVTSYLYKQNLKALADLSNVSDDEIVFAFVSMRCGLDDCLDEEENTRKNLNTWNNRILIKDF